MKAIIQAYSPKEIKRIARGELAYLHISAPTIYDEPKELYEFVNYKKYQICKERNCFSGDCLICPQNAILTSQPKSWQYVEELQINE